MIAGTVVDVHDLVEVIWVSATAATILVIAVSFAILGASRANNERREGHTTAAVAYGSLALLGGVICAGGVVLAVSVMLAK
jgi:hypothetical protein